MEQNDIKDSIEEIKSFKKKIKENIKNDPNVKSGKITEEELENEPMIELYDAISDASISILSLPSVNRAFEILKNKIGNENAKSLIEMLAVVMTNSAMNAVVYYDSKQDPMLEKMFNDFKERINLHGSIIDGHEDILKIYRNKVDALEHDVKMLKMYLDNRNK